MRYDAFWEKLGGDKKKKEEKVTQASQKWESLFIGGQCD